jgi:hypothetical protein
MASRHTTLTNGALVAAIVRNNYIATGEQVEHLAHTVVSGLRAGEVYLRILVAHMQSKLGRPRRGKQPPQEPVLDAVHAEQYPYVLKGVGPDEMAEEERNSLANFARSMASTVRYFIRHGGDVRGLDVGTVTKTGLRKMVTPEDTAEPIVGGTRAERAFLRAAEGVKKQVAAMARGDPDNARERLEQFMEELDKLLNDLGEGEDIGGQTTTIVGANIPPPDRGVARTRVGVPQLHRGA